MKETAWLFCAKSVLTVPMKILWAVLGSLPAILKIGSKLLFWEWQDNLAAGKFPAPRCEHSFIENRRTQRKAFDKISYKSKRLSQIDVIAFAWRNFKRCNCWQKHRFCFRADVSNIFITVIGLWCFSWFYKLLSWWWRSGSNWQVTDLYHNLKSVYLVLLQVWCRHMVRTAFARKPKSVLKRSPQVTPSSRDWKFWAVFTFNPKTVNQSFQRKYCDWFCKNWILRSKLLQMRNTVVSPWRWSFTDNVACVVVSCYILGSHTKNIAYLVIGL